MESPNVVSKNSRLWLHPALWICFAALLWSTDSVVRISVAEWIDFKWIVCLEHLVGLFFITLWLVYRMFGAYPFKLNLSVKDLLLLLVVGIGGSALGGIFFTHSMRLIGAPLATLFIVLQPVFVFAFAWIFLNERRKLSFYQAGFWIILSAAAISIPDFDFGMEGETKSISIGGLLLAVLATTLWAGSTVAGKSLLRKHPPLFVVFYRWLSASIFMLLLLASTGEKLEWRLLLQSNEAAKIVYLAVFCGILPMLIYYRGLRRLPASTVTLIELLYPVAGVFLPALYLGQKLSLIQLFAGLSMAVSLVVLMAIEALGSEKKKL